MKKYYYKLKKFYLENNEKILYKILFLIIESLFFFMLGVLIIYTINYIYYAFIYEVLYTKYIKYVYFFYKFIYYIFYK